MDGNIRFLFLVFYLISVPAIDLMLILSIDKNLDIIKRILASICSVIAIILLFLINYSLSMFQKEAHRPYNRLNSIIARRPATTALDLKVLGLIEKLSGPVIGIYCLDIFPFTNYQFYLYISNCILNFLLIIGLLGY